MKVHRKLSLKTSFDVVLTEEDVANFVMQGVITKLGCSSRTARAVIRDGNLTTVEIEMEEPMDAFLRTVGQSD